MFNGLSRLFSSVGFPVNVIHFNAFCLFGPLSVIAALSSLSCVLANLQDDFVAAFVQCGARIDILLSVIAFLSHFTRVTSQVLLGKASLPKA